MFESLFQSFDDPPPADTSARLIALRAELARRGFDGFVIPHADRHQNEYLPASEERLAWITAFTGLAGSAVVWDHKAALFGDGRYTSQAPQQVDAAQFTIVNSGETSPEKWIEANLPAG